MNLLKVIFPIIIAFCDGTVFAQSLAPKQAADQLQPIAVRLIQEASDLQEMSRGRRRDCDTATAFNELFNAISVATEEIQAAQTLVYVYSLVSSPADRQQISNFLAFQLSGYCKQLRLQIASVNLALGLPETSPGAAVLGTRVRDDIRAAIDILQDADLR